MIEGLRLNLKALVSMGDAWKRAFNDRVVKVEPPLTLNSQDA